MPCSVDITERLAHFSKEDQGLYRRHEVGDWEYEEWMEWKFQLGYNVCEKL